MRDSYLARNGGVLNANGADSFEVLINSGSVLNAVGGTFAGRSGNAGVSVTNASASLTDAVVTGDRMGMAVNRLTGNPTGSSVVISGSQITGRTAGLEASGGSTTVMTDTHLTATAATGVGLNSFGGEVHAKGGTITGGLHGIRLRPDSQGVGNGANVILDNVQVQGLTGAAILATSGVTTHIQVLNYTRLLSGTGLLLDVQQASNATMEVVGSTLEGKLNVADNSTANLAFQHGLMAGDVLVSGASTTALQLDRSELRGNIVIADNSKGNLIFDQSQMTGDVIAKGASTADLNVIGNSLLTGTVNFAEGSTGNLNFNQGHMVGNVLVNDSIATVAFANGSSLEGDVNFTGNSRAGLTFDQSQMKGNVLIDSLPDTTTLKFANNSILDGNVNIAGGSKVDLGVDQSRMTGDVIAKGASTTNLNVIANSLLTGAVDIAEGSTGNLDFNQGHMAGDVRVNDSTATVAFANGSSLEGDVNFTGNSVAKLAFDQSQMKGDVLIDSLPGATAVSFTDNSVLTGNVNIGGGSHVDLKFDQSQLAGDVRVAGNSTTQMALNNSTYLGNLNISDDSTANLTLNQSQMTGDVLVDGLNTTESVTLENQSQLTGRLDKVNSVNIKSQSNWTLTGNDNIGTLAMNGGSVTFGATEATSTYYTLNVGTLAGTTGTFVMKGDFVSGESDKLIVAGQSTGNYGLAVAASGLDAIAPEQVVLVRTGTTDGASFTLAGDRAVDLGTWSYSLASRTNAEGGKEWYLDPTTEVISPGAQSILALFNTPVTSWYGEQSSLRTRMGELRLNGGQSGGWMRTYGSQYNVADGSGVGYQQNQQGISLGADARVGDSQWLVGVLAGTSKSDLNLDHGTTGTVKSYYVGPYLTWMSDKGYYFDGVLKFNRFRNESKVNLSDDTRAKGDYDNWGLGASAEFGRQFKLADGYFVEPFTQWSAVQIQGKRYTLDNDMTADGDTTRSLLGKAGVTVGRNFEFGKASIAQPYLRMAVAHEFAKNNEVKVNDNVFNNDLSGTRGEFGAGVAVAMSEKWQVHADFDYSNGEHIEKPWGATLGVRWFW
ncbi:autotransporter outer membrane beta-barrel domain-containing protein [Pseudomonas sp. PS01303]|uniref:autotransporter outer membrane beta-barrel domain-containing protein n=1 Tax=Pseudomonas sp. PS01303 TaxID=2991439 RepID=UPI00249C7506|nr:autotransporter outer membrane beta-barrel domain-containing protein [Pseudomonas sp. PS01303]